MFKWLDTLKGRSLSKSRLHQHFHRDFKTAGFRMIKAGNFLRLAIADDDPEAAVILLDKVIFHLKAQMIRLPVKTQKPQETFQI